ncbi:MAG: nicotinate-nucleotide--dimethylbenzimidazole phosphoribosyltransferase [Pseudomonadota bacterium]
MNFYQKTRNHMNLLAKPLGSLGELEHLAAKVSEAQQIFPPQYHKPKIVIFAADHGVAIQEKVSLFDSSITKAMVDTFLSGRAAISVLARLHQASLEIVNCGVRNYDGPRFKSDPIQYVDAGVSKNPTQNIAIQNAMSKEECEKALEAGRLALRRLQNEGSTIAIAGEMGIGNTTAATSIYCRLLNLPPEQLTGPGAGLDQSGILHKSTIIAKALKRSSAKEPLDVLASLGGFEIAALVGFYLEAEAKNIPVLLDGFICGAACQIAHGINPDVKRVIIPATLSGEPHHHKALSALDMGQPILSLGLRLGEGSAAATALPILKAAIALANEMATISEVLESLS